MDSDTGPCPHPIKLTDELAPHRRVIGVSRNIEHHKIFLAIDGRANGAVEFEAVEEEMQRRLAVLVDGDVRRTRDSNTERRTKPDLIREELDGGEAVATITLSERDLSLQGR